MVFNIFSLKHIIASYHVQGDDKENLVSSWPGETKERARTSCALVGVTMVMVTQTISVTWLELSYRVVTLVNEMTVPVLEGQAVTPPQSTPL